MKPKGATPGSATSLELPLLDIAELQATYYLIEMAICQKLIAFKAISSTIEVKELLKPATPFVRYASSWLSRFAALDSAKNSFWISLIVGWLRIQLMA